MVVRKAIFIDAEGALRPEIRAESPFAAGAPTALPLLFAAGYRVVALGGRTAASQEAKSREARLRHELAGIGVPLAAYYCCSHKAARKLSSCDCRKPMPGLLRRAAGDHRLDLPQSWAVGDTLDDVEAAHAAGCRAVLVDNGAEREWRADGMRRPDAIADGLTEAALIIAAWKRGGIHA